MRVSLGAPGGSPPRQIDAYTFGFGSRRYRGTFAVERAADGTDVVVNTLPLDAYLYGVVSHEVPRTWPRAALQAQAVAARTYAFLRRRPSQPFDVVDSTGDQFYGGVDFEEVPVRDAVDSTSGLFVLWNGRPAHVLFSSCCGGYTADVAEVRLPARPVEVALGDLDRDDRPPQSSPIFAPVPRAARSAMPATPGADAGAPIEPTAADIDAEPARRGRGGPYVPPVVVPVATPLPDAPAYGGAPPQHDPAAVASGEFPYLRAHADPYCADAPNDRWHEERPFTAASYYGDVAGALGALRSIERRDVDASGRCAAIRMIGSKSAFDIDATDFRRRVGASVIRSTRLTQIGYDGTTLAVDGRGFGHGVGLCQWGARGLAATGATVEEVVAFYFPGTALGSV